jgi:hypothetical protein
MPGFIRYSPLPTLVIMSFSSILRRESEIDLSVTLNSLAIFSRLPLDTLKYPFLFIMQAAVIRTIKSIDDSPLITHLHSSVVLSRTNVSPSENVITSPVSTLTQVSLAIFSHSFRKYTNSICDMQTFVVKTTKFCCFYADLCCENNQNLLF